MVTEEFDRPWPLFIHYDVDVLNEYPFLIFLAQAYLPI